jgi:ABC-type Fe3+-hydroxamate transport system substrate-binding protein
MSYSPPTPPQELPDNVVESLETHSPELLRHIAQYAEALAEYREREARIAEQDDEEEQIEKRPEDLPDDVPSKATITTKEINDNRYYYWQWREGDRILSKYKGPVNPND